MSLAPGANLPLVSLIPVANSHCCHWHRRQIWHQQQIWHQRQISHRCHWYRWCILTCEYLRAEFLEKFETTLILFSGVWKKSNHGKNLKQKISWHCLFGTDSDQNRTLEEIPRSGADSLPLIKPLRRTRTLCDQTQTQVWSESSVDEHNLYFARLAIVG